MLLQKTRERNEKLIKAAIRLHQEGKIRPDAYVVDLDCLLYNAKVMLEESKRLGLHLYFMLKQLGRNPYIAKELIALGYEGAVVVDYKEAKIMMEHQIPIGNVGHLVQVPEQLLEEMILYGVELITVYSLEKIKSIQKICQKHKIKQKIMLRVFADEDLIYSGQTAGFHLEELEPVVSEIKSMGEIEIGGVTSFPTLLFQEETQEIFPTENLYTVLKAKAILMEYGITVEQINLPSATCTSSLKTIKEYGGTHGEPGHGLTGTTPAHALCDLEEIPAVVYVSEISHNFGLQAYCYGGGHYRRSRAKSALVGMDMAEAELILPDLDSIDYHFGLGRNFKVGETVVMAFRYQMFVTRSDVVLVRNIQNEEQLVVVAIYDSLGREL
jgi:Predicted amino acid racemase